MMNWKKIYALLYRVKANKKRAIKIEREIKRVKSKEELSMDDIGRLVKLYKLLNKLNYDE